MGCAMLVTEMSSEKLDSCEESANLRLKAGAFTRHRRLGAKQILLMLLHRMVDSLQLSIDFCYDTLGENPISKQAFSQARANLNPAFVRSFADGIAEICAKDPSAPSYLGMRLVAIDGTDIALENTAELKEAFGCSGPNKDAATASASLAYEPLDGTIYDCQIASYDTDERTLAKLHIQRLLELGMKGSLLLFDRWYPSKEFIAHTLNAGLSFVMRVRDKWNLEVDAIRTQGWVTLKHEGKLFRVRVLKVKLSSGETETLLTNLNQKQLPIAQAGELYFKRWGVEVAYDLMKSKLQLENFSGKTKVSVEQDFYATVYLAGFAAVCAAEADAQIQAIDSDKGLKYPRKANRNRTIAKLRERFYIVLLEPNPAIRQRLMDRLIEDIAQRPVSVRPGRSPKRKPPRRKRFFAAKRDGMA